MAGEFDQGDRASQGADQFVGLGGAGRKIQLQAQDIVAAGLVKKNNQSLSTLPCLKNGGTETTIAGQHLDMMNTTILCDL
jgi:hypothetical protein